MSHVGPPASAGGVENRALPEAWRELGRGVLELRPDNLVARPWAGNRLAAYKGLPGPTPAGDGFGEAFEVAAFPADEETRAHPSTVRLPDESEMLLPELLELAGEELLGADHLAAHGPVIPLLPKTLDVGELLSVQSHPPGNPELYLVLDADPEATVRLGFREDIDPVAFGERCARGRRVQEELLAELRSGVDQQELQSLLAPAWADRELARAALVERLAPWLRPGHDAAGLEARLELLHGLFWQTLDLLNEVPARPGQIIWNATPARLAAEGTYAAEVHALGNPERRGILMLEIRRPAPTFRVWDNVRCPPREIDIERALGALNLRATRPEEFLLEPRPCERHPGRWRIVETPYFAAESWRLGEGETVRVPSSGVHTLHAVRGMVEIVSEERQRLERGQSAVVPIATARAGYELTVASSPEGGAEVVRVEIPLA